MPQGRFYLRMEDSLRPGYTSVCFILSSRTNMSVSARPVLLPGQPAKCRAISAETPCLQPNNRREEWSTGISSLPHHEKERNICQKRRLQTKQATPKKGRRRQSPPAFQILSESDRCTDFKIRKENPLQTSALNGYYLYHPGRPFWKRSGNVHLPRMVSGSAKAALR